MSRNNKFFWANNDVAKYQAKHALSCCNTGNDTSTDISKAYDKRNYSLNSVCCSYFRNDYQLGIVIKIIEKLAGNVVDERWCLAVTFLATFSWVEIIEIDIKYLLKYLYLAYDWKSLVMKLSKNAMFLFKQVQETTTFKSSWTLVCHQLQIYWYVIFILIQIIRNRDHRTSIIVTVYYLCHMLITCLLYSVRNIPLGSRSETADAVRRCNYADSCCQRFKNAKDACPKKSSRVT